MPTFADRIAVGQAYYRGDVRLVVVKRVVTKKGHIRLFHDNGIVYTWLPDDSLRLA